MNNVFEKQQQFFLNDKTKDLTFRKEQLENLLNVLKENEEQLNDAIYNDFSKSSFETYATELALIYHEIKLALRKLKRWSKPKRVRTNLANFPAKSYIIPEPYGNALIVGAWNYPYQLSLFTRCSCHCCGKHSYSKTKQAFKKYFGGNGRYHQ
jgi:aldehyde dehydrogenase (NAD+)